MNRVNTPGASSSIGTRISIVITTRDDSLTRRRIIARKCVFPLLSCSDVCARGLMATSARCNRSSLRTIASRLRLNYSVQLPFSNVTMISAEPQLACGAPRCVRLSMNPITVIIALYKFPLVCRDIRRTRKEASRSRTDSSLARSELSRFFNEWETALRCCH